MAESVRTFGVERGTWGGGGVLLELSWQYPCPAMPWSSGGAEE